MNAEIKFLHNSEIDILKWDKVVDDAINSRVYALSWYLDILHPDWHGLIYGDFEYVMPVIFSKKWGINYMFQPVYAQQHGIFPPSHEVTEQFISFLQKKFRYFNVSLNTLNSYKKEDVDIEERINFVLSLKDNYDYLSSRYSSHTKRYTKKARSEADISRHISLDDYLRFKERYGKLAIEKKYSPTFKLIMSHSIEKNRGVVYGAYSKHNELCGAAFFIKENDRYTYLNSVLSHEGKQQRVMYAIVDFFIQDHAGQNYLLDFEGSNMGGIARFFEGFGATIEKYQHLKYNNLFRLLKLLKK